MLAAANARLRSLTEIRPIDVDVADADLQEAIADTRRARAEADAATIRSPYDGRVVKFTRGRAKKSKRRAFWSWRRSTGCT